MNNRFQEYLAKQTSNFQDFFGDYSTWTIRKKLSLTLIPSIMLILLLTGYLSNWFSNRYLNLALERNVRQLALAQANSIEELLEHCRQELLLLERSSPDRNSLRNFMLSHNELGLDYYRELVLIEQNPEDNAIFISNSKDVFEISQEKAGQIQPDYLRLLGKLPPQEPDSVFLSDITEVLVGPGLCGENSPSLGLEVMRLVTPHVNPRSKARGYLVLSIDAKALRNILSLYNSAKSPLYAYSRSSERRFSFFFDELGWILFQSENIEDKDKELSTDFARIGMSGDHGRPGQLSAFRPHAKHETFWSMHSQIVNYHHGIEYVDAEFEPTSSPFRLYFLGYAPVRFNSSPGKALEIVGGVAYLDRSLLLTAAQYRQFDLISIITLGSVLLVAVLIYLLSRAITKPIRSLALQVENIESQDKLQEIELPDSDLETTSLKHAINSMISKLKTQSNEIRHKQAQIEIVKARQKVAPPSNYETKSRELEPEIEGIVGRSQAVSNLKKLILKASRVDADVLIIGDTGTGKELTSLAIHRLSQRRDKPFISINCGALDENLLLDSLFGHVKGAFSEAKSDRKGAFLAAQGGTLMLDEIGNASAKVQQALLRALAVRKIRPLGHDADLDFDVRVIAATNVDLKESVKLGRFREDLYYRLKVISITTPNLSQHPEDIPILADYFLKESANYMKKGDLSLSRGALDALKEHTWQGNVRELKNCITTAVALSESDTIYAEDLKLEQQSRQSGVSAEIDPGQAPSQEKVTQDEPQTLETDWTEDIDSLPGLNSRQRLALRLAGQERELTRSAYQQSLGGDVPSRTAQYDLGELVKKGLLVKSGRGPSTCYRLALSRNKPS